MIFPVLLGAGRRLFADTPVDKPVRLSVSSDVRGGDLQLLVLHPVRDGNRPSSG